MNAIAYLHDYRPVEPLDIEAHRLRIARDAMREADMHRPAFVRECCAYLMEHGTPHEQIEAEARIMVMNAAERRRQWCMGSVPPAVKRHRAKMAAEAVGAIACGAIGGGLLAYLLIGGL